jgi:ABC-type uncharacterized transport system substrate-binding protein
MRMRAEHRRLHEAARYGFTALLCLASLLAPAHAHPHMFIECGVEFAVDDSGLAGMEITWQMDQMNSAWIMDEFDTDRNGAFDAQEQKNIYTQIFAAASKDNYFIRITCGLRMVDSVTVERFAASIRDDAFVVYSFHVPCGFALRDMEGRDVSVMFEDPTIYVAFDVVKKRVHVRGTERVGGTVSFSTIDYSEVIVLNVTRKQS